MIVTESVFSMDGDSAPLRELVELKERYGAWLMVDEAHATGLYGERGQGLASQLGVADRIELQMGTLGKALGVSGGYIAGSRKLVDYLINRARSFVFSTAPPPAVVAAVTKAVHLAQSLEGANLREELWARVALLRATWIPLKFALPKERHPILPLLVGEERAAIALADALRDYGIFVPAVRYPTVARGAARLRFTTTAAHSEDDHLSVLRAILAIRRRKAE